MGYILTLSYRPKDYGTQQPWSLDHLSSLCLVLLCESL